MKFRPYIFLLFSFLLVISCNKEEPSSGSASTLPDGAEPYTEEDIQFVPYNSGNRNFATLPDLDSSLTLVFKERLRSEDYFAWDQTFFQYGDDPTLELELRLRYLQSDVSQKTLAMYFPYYDNGGILRQNLFEVPVSSEGIETSFFQDIVTFHDTIVLNAIEFYDVFEIQELVGTDADKDSPINNALVFYNKTYGLIQMKQRDGTRWMLQF
ncbi:MAG: hypothetical protein MK078_12825 [Crocinitomicaceae bacterium]|nr:hypothetical protein [Crocinitomicaceae bacterium]